MELVLLRSTDWRIKNETESCVTITVVHGSHRGYRFWNCPVAPSLKSITDLFSVPVHLFILFIQYIYCQKTRHY